MVAGRMHQMAQRDDARQPAHRLTESFEEGAGWDRKGDRERMRRESDGFWLVLYLTDGSRRPFDARTWSSPEGDGKPGCAAQRDMWITAITRTDS